MTGKNPFVMLINEQTTVLHALYYETLLCADGGICARDAHIHAMVSAALIYLWKETKLRLPTYEIGTSESVILMSTTTRARILT